MDAAAGSCCRTRRPLLQIRPGRPSRGDSVDPEYRPDFAASDAEAAVLKKETYSVVEAARSMARIALLTSSRPVRPMLSGLLKPVTRKPLRSVGHRRFWTALLNSSGQRSGSLTPRKGWPETRELCRKMAEGGTTAALSIFS